MLTSSKDFPQLMISRRNHNEMGWRGRDMEQSRPTCPGGQPAKRRIRTIVVVLPKEARVLSANWTSQPS